MTFDKFYELLCEGTAPRSFSCLMLDCSNLYQYVNDLHAEIDPDDIYDDEPGHGLTHDPHITTLYGIHTSKFSEVLDVINLKPIKYKLTKLSLFENEKFDVLKFEVESKDLHALNKQCTENLEYTNKFSEYKPHLTVAYLKPGTGLKYIKKDCPIIGQSFTSNRFIFSDKNSNKVWKDV